MVRLDADQLAILLVGGIHGCEAPSTSALVEQPEIREGCGERAGNVTNSMRTDVG